MIRQLDAPFVDLRTGDTLADDPERILYPLYRGAIVTECTTCEHVSIATVSCGRCGGTSLEKIDREDLRATIADERGARDVPRAAALLAEDRLREKFAGLVAS